MNVDTAIQTMLFKWSNARIERIVYLGKCERDIILNHYKEAYGWTIAQCEEFLDNATLAYELLIKDKVECITNKKKNA